MAQANEAFNEQLNEIDLGDLVDNLLAPGHAAAIRSEAMEMNDADLVRAVKKRFTPENSLLHMLHRDARWSRSLTAVLRSCCALA